eukprot:gene22261-29331_t
MASLSDRFNINSQIEHLQAKHIGTGHADHTKFEWALNMHRDSYSSYIGHHNMLSYFSVVENESIGRVRYEFLQKMLLPCGIPPKPADASDSEMEEEEEEDDDEPKQKKNRSDK